MSFYFGFSLSLSLDKTSVGRAADGNLRIFLAATLPKLHPPPARCYITPKPLSIFIFAILLLLFDFFIFSSLASQVASPPARCYITPKPISILNCKEKYRKLFWYLVFFAITSTGVTCMCYITPEPVSIFFLTNFNFNHVPGQSILCFFLLHAMILHKSVLHKLNYAFMHLNTQLQSLRTSSQASKL